MGKKIKQFFIYVVVIFFTILQIIWIVLTAVFRKKFWKIIFGSKDLKSQSSQSDVAFGEPKKAPVYDKIYTVSIKNTEKKNPDDKEQKKTKVSLFGANELLLQPKFGIPDNIEVTTISSYSTYTELMMESMTSPFVLEGFRISSDNNNQLEEVLVVNKRDASGSSATFPIDIISYLSAFQFQPNMIDVLPYKITVTGKTKISFDIHPDTTVRLTLFVKKQVNLESLLKSDIDESPVRYRIEKKEVKKNIFRRIKEFIEEKINSKKSKWLK